jgi:hypothetical protein
MSLRGNEELRWWRRFVDDALIITKINSYSRSGDTMPVARQKGKVK